jgi:hypothetical protein
MNREALGGQSASERKPRDIYECRMKNLLTAFEENRHQRIDFLRVFDNSENFGRPHLVLSMVRGVPKHVARKSLPGLKPLLSIQVVTSKTYAVPCAAEAVRDC